MIARLSVSVFLAACVMWPTLVSAQGETDPEGVVTIGEGMPAPLVPQFTSQWKPLPSAPEQDAESPIDAIIRAQSPQGPIQYAGAYAPQSGVDSYGDGSGFQAPVYNAQPLPWERDYNSPFKKFITEVLPNNYFRVEYLSWNIDDIGAQAVGAPTALTNDVREPIQSAAFFASMTPDPDATASQTLLVPTTESLNFNKVSGLRATYGIPLTFGRMEFSAFALEDAESSILDPSFGPIRGTRTLVAPEFQAQPFVLAQNLVVPNPGFITTSGGIVLAQGQLIANPNLAGVVNNIPANSLLPTSAFPFAPGNPPISSTPAGLVDPAVLPTVTNINNGATIPLPPGNFFYFFNVQGQNVTLPGDPAIVGNLPNGPLFIRNRDVADFRQVRAPLVSPLFPIPNVVDPSRNPIPGSPPFDQRFPGGDAIILVTPPGSGGPLDTQPRFIAPGVTTLLADVLSPNGITLPAGTVLRTNETGFAAMPLLNNGAVDTTFLIFDGGYNADYRSNVWGSQAKLILDIGPDHNGMTLKPLIGFRYMSVDEQFRQVGLSTLNVLQLNPVLPVFVFPEPLRASVIDSKVENNLYGLQVGTSVEYNHKYFSLGVEPKISLGVNNYEASVTTSQLRSVFDPTVTTEDDALIFAPVFDVAMYGQVHLTPYFSLHAGYNFTYLFRVTRPAENIVYNDNGPNAPPGVVVDSETQDMHIQGLTIGGEFRFRDLKFR